MIGGIWWHKNRHPMEHEDFSVRPDIAYSDRRASCICQGNDACSYDGRIAHRVIF
jgi:hypothetical protein